MENSTTTDHRGARLRLPMLAIAAVFVIGATFLAGCGPSPVTTPPPAGATPSGATDIQGNTQAEPAEPPILVLPDYPNWKPAKPVNASPPSDLFFFQRARVQTTRMSASGEDYASISYNYVPLGTATTLDELATASKDFGLAETDGAGYFDLVQKEHTAFHDYPAVHYRFVGAGGEGYSAFVFLDRSFVVGVLAVYRIRSGSSNRDALMGEIETILAQVSLTW